MSIVGYGARQSERVKKVDTARFATQTTAALSGISVKGASASQFAAAMTAADTTQAAAADQEKSAVTPFVDALSALVPAEILLAHAAIIELSVTTTKQGTSVANTNTLKATFWVLLVLCPVLYILARKTVGQASKWQKWDYVRCMVPAAAFVTWTLLLPVSMFDAFASIDKTQRTIWGVVAAVVVGSIAASLAYTTSPT